MTKVTDAKFSSYVVLTAILTAAFAYELLQFAEYVDELTVPCQHSTDVVDGKCDCTDSPFAGKYCDTSACRRGKLVRTAVTTPFAGTPWGCRCDGAYWGYLCGQCTSVECDDAASGCQTFAGARYFKAGDGALPCDHFCSANLTRDTRYRHSEPDAQRFRDTENNGGTATFCSGHGACTSDGCRCDPHYFASQDGVAPCEATCPDYEGVMCAGHGTCSDAGGSVACVCDRGYAGDVCQHKCPSPPNGTICSQNGRCTFNATTQTAYCACQSGFTGEACAQTCPADNALVCAGHGTCTAQPTGSDGACVCQAGWSTSTCNCNVLLTCTGHGDCTEDGCLCDDQDDRGHWDGARCNRCKHPYTGPLCNVECAPNMCHGNGRCVARDDQAACNCIRGFNASQNCAACQTHMFPRVGVAEDACTTFMDAETCHFHGHPSDAYDGDNAKCVCDGHFDASTDCQGCAQGWFPEGTCERYCDADTCGDHGSCGDDGACVCEEGFSGAACDSTCGTGCGKGRCVANVLDDDVAFSCACEDNAFGQQCDQTCPKHDKRVCNSAGECAPKAFDQTCHTDAECTAHFHPADFASDMFCDYALLPVESEDGVYEGCVGEMALDVYDPTEVNTKDAYYYRTQDGAYVYPVYHQAAGVGVPVQVDAYTLYLTDTYSVNATPRARGNTELACRHILHGDACSGTQGCLWSDRFCSIEMKANTSTDEYAWCNGVLTYQDPKGCAALDGGGCDLTLCVSPMSRNTHCRHTTGDAVLRGWEKHHYETDPWTTPSLLLTEDQDPAGLQLSTDVVMTDLCAAVAALPPVTSLYNASSLDGVALSPDTIANFAGFDVCGTTVDTWDEAWARNVDECVITPQQHAAYSPPTRARDMCAAVRTATGLTFDQCADAFGGAWDVVTNGNYSASGAHVSFWYRKHAGVVGPRVLFRNAAGDTTATLFVDERFYLNAYTAPQACPLTAPACNNFIENDVWYHVSLTFGDAVVLQVGDNRVNATAADWTSLEVVGLQGEEMHNLLVHDQPACAPLYRRTQYPYGVSSNVTAVALCRQYEDLHEPHATFDFEAYCAFAATLTDPLVFVDRADALQCANLHAAGTCFDKCETMGADAAQQASYCQARDLYYAEAAVRSPMGEETRCRYSTAHWIDHCTTMKNESTRRGVCSVAACQCSNAKKVGVGGDACELTCPMNKQTDTPCGNSMGFDQPDLGVCVANPNITQTSTYIVGQCQCYNGGDETQACHKQCTNYDCNLNQVSNMTVRGDACNSNTSGFVTEFERLEGKACTVSATNQSVCECEDCAGFMRVGDTCAHCSHIGEGDDVVYRKTPVQQGQQPRTPEECQEVGGTMVGGACQVDGVVSTVAQCVVVFTAGSCDNGAGNCQCEVPRTAAQFETNTYFGGTQTLEEDVSFGSHKRLNMMQGLDAYLRHHVRLNTSEPIDDPEAVRDRFMRRPQDFSCDDPRYVRPGKYCDRATQQVCSDGYVCLHHSCQPGDPLPADPAWFRPEHCKYDNMIRSALSGTSPWTGFNCDKQCPGVDTTSAFPDDYLGCSGHGTCSRGTCNCDDAAKMVQFSNHRRVVNGQIVQSQRNTMSTNDMTGWRGIACEKQCPGYDTATRDHTQSCSGHGECTQNARCICEPGWVGTDDNGCTLQCPSGDALNECSGHGVCQAQMVNVEDYNDPMLVTAFASACTDPLWVDMMSPDAFVSDGTLPVGVYVSKDSYYSDARFEWDGDGTADVSVVFEGAGGNAYTFSVNATHLRLDDAWVPKSGRVFVEMDQHTWKIGMYKVGMSVLSQTTVAVSYPFSLHVEVTSGTLTEFRLGVGVWDGAVDHTGAAVATALTKITDCAQIGWEETDGYCTYHGLRCALPTRRFGGVAMNTCQRGSIFYADDTCHHSIKNARTWTRPTVQIVQTYNKGTVTQTDVPRTASAFKNMRYKLAVCDCMEGWNGADCQTCDVHLGGANCRRTCPDVGGTCNNRGICLWGSQDGEGKDHTFYDASCVCGLYNETGTRYALEPLSKKPIYEGDTWVFFGDVAQTPYDALPTHFTQPMLDCTCEDGFAGPHCQFTKPSCLFGFEASVQNDDICNCSANATESPIFDNANACCPYGFTTDRTLPQRYYEFEFDTDFDASENKYTIRKRCTAPDGVVRAYQTASYSAATTNTLCMDATAPSAAVGGPTRLNPTDVTTVQDIYNPDAVQECANKCGHATFASGFTVNANAVEIQPAAHDTAAGTVGSHASRAIAHNYANTGDNCYVGTGNTWWSVTLGKSVSALAVDYYGKYGEVNVAEVRVAHRPASTRNPSGYTADEWFSQYTTTCGAVHSNITNVDQQYGSTRINPYEHTPGQTIVCAPGAGNLGIATDGTFNTLYLKATDLTICKLALSEPACACSSSVGCEESKPADGYLAYTFEPQLMDTTDDYGTIWEKLTAQAQPCTLKAGEASPHGGTFGCVGAHTFPGCQDVTSGTIYAADTLATFVDLVTPYNPRCRKDSSHGCATSDGLIPCTCKSGYTFTERNRQLVAGSTGNTAHSQYMLGTTAAWGYSSAVVNVSTCDKCAPGLYRSGNTCHVCPSGQYQNEVDKHECKSCAAGTQPRYVNGFADNGCVPCQPGRYSASGYACLMCHAGKSSASGALACADCVQGRFAYGNTNSGRWSAGPSCVGCYAGRYEATAGTYATNPADACHACPKGYYQTSTGQHVCTACAHGRYSDAEGSATNQCEACQTGKFSDGSHTVLLTGTCTSCAPGKHQDQTGQTACKPCQSGKATNAHGRPTCSTCAGGKYADGTGKTSCTNCPRGYHQCHHGDSTSCAARPAGRYVDQEGKACGSTWYTYVGTDPCLPCAPYRKPGGGWYSAQEQVETSNQYANNGHGCPAGTGICKYPIQGGTYNREYCYWSSNPGNRLAQPWNDATDNQYIGTRI